LPSSVSSSAEPSELLYLNCVIVIKTFSIHCEVSKLSKCWVSEPVVRISS
jgi:hypothetical protein